MRSTARWFDLLSSFLGVLLVGSILAALGVVALSTRRHAIKAPQRTHRGIADQTTIRSAAGNFA
ncbi:hypothetical protein [Paraburkholderia hospita]|uniref:hypothetical protein n=1 Tax=Paraburkholderia hospita TaxID=169430 RepID=UPI000B80FC37|nr:hypothetical protein [Paraburkholderia hospita]